MSLIDRTLTERGERYGSFEGYAITSGVLNRCVSNHSEGNEDLEFIHLEAIRMIMSKIARILNGNPNYADNWHDIAGYATLVEKHLNKKGDK